MDYISRYLGSIRDRRVIPDVKPGYMRKLLPDTAPAEPEDWEIIFNDVENVIMPGVGSCRLSIIYEQRGSLTKRPCPPFRPQVVHWQSPHMHAYYPSLTSWPSMLGDMLADAINCVGFTWVRWKFSRLCSLTSHHPDADESRCGQASSPACTELEMNVMDWLCKALGLPSFFLHHHADGRGGGILQVPPRCVSLTT